MIPDQIKGADRSLPCAAGLLDLLLGVDLDLHQLDAAFAAQFMQTCANYAADLHTAPFWQLLEARLRHVLLDTRIEAALATLDAAPGGMAISALARSQHMSLRSLQTRFLDQVGLTPKEYGRIQRLAATIRQLDGHAQPLSELASHAGFADQAHATRELQSLVGLTPAKLRRALQAEREGDATLRMAAAFVRGHAAS